MTVPKLPKAKKELVAQLTELATTAVNAFWMNPDSLERDAKLAVAEIQRLTGVADYDEFYFHALMGWGSPEEFAARAALGIPAAADLDRSDIAALVEKIATSPGPEADYCQELLERSFPYADVSDAIHWPDRERTSEETADEILLRKALFESGGADAVRLHLVSLANGVMADTNAPLWAQTWAETVVGKNRDGH
ncbi:MAG TPA: hypothetical protein DHW63_02230 [Hyphomonadaceae bacterium]|nr:hypothetical protein [Hyphomonadaceae bacterium]